MATSREMEEYGVVPIHFRFFFPGLETALHPAVVWPWVLVTLLHGFLQMPF